MLLVLLYVSPSFSFFPSLCPFPSRLSSLSRLPLARPVVSSPTRWPRSHHALFALVYRPLVDRSFCFFEVALLLLRPRVGATLGLVLGQVFFLGTETRERTVATIDLIL